MELENNGTDEKLHRLWVVLCAVGDPHNVGAILRTAYYLGVDKVITTDYNLEDDMGSRRLKGTSCMSPVVSKASAGVLEIFQPFYMNDSEALIQRKKAEGWDIIGSGLRCKEGSTGFGAGVEHHLTSTTIGSSRPSILIIGNEGFGIPEKLSEMCDTWLNVKPGRQLHPDVDSLNVSVATALLIKSIIKN